MNPYKSSGIAAVGILAVQPSLCIDFFEDEVVQCVERLYL